MSRQVQPVPLLGVLALAAGAVAQAPASELGDIFDPAGRVPLSEYVHGDEVPPGGTLSMTVEPALLAAITAFGGSLEVAQRDPTGDPALTVFHAPTLVDAVTGTVTLQSDVDEPFVVTVAAMTNDLPVVTHWDASKNLGRGGQSPGATDGISTFVLDLADTKPGDLTQTGGSLLNATSWGDAGGTFMFATDLYAVFSDGSELTDVKDGDVADRDVPGFEHYIGENYSTTAVSDEVALWLSDFSRAHSGWPIVHRNSTTAFDPLAPLAQQVRDLMPAFQIVHGFIVPNADDPLHDGLEQSLATFILPPFWEAAPARDYAVLFNGFYDLNSSTVGVVGRMFLEQLGSLFVEDERSAVGILWNGGGAGACQTMQRSAYDNAAVLFDQAAQLVAADTQRMVFTGGSRGGTTGLAIASNPFHSNYSARFVIASNPQSFPGQAIAEYSNPTYGLVQSAVADQTGYQDGWMETWTHHLTGETGKQLAMQAFLGSTDPVFIDDNLANGSDLFLDALAAKGTRVVMRVGTHDFSRSFTHQARLYERMVSKGIPVRMEVSYRFGHGHTVGTQPDQQQLLNQAIDNDPTLATGLVHYKKASVTDYATGVEFSPSHQPFAVEAPILTGMGQTHTWAFMGAPGTPWEIHLAKIDDVILEQSLQVVPLGPLTPLFSGVLPSTGGELAWDSLNLFMPVVPAAFGGYTYELRYADHLGVMQSVSFGGSAPPLLPQDPLFILWNAPVLGLSDVSRTGGIASDPLF